MSFPISFKKQNWRVQVTKPFNFEGRKRMAEATQAIEELRKNVDTLLVVSNDKLLQLVPEGADSDAPSPVAAGVPPIGRANTAHRV